jgi:hypothetical protein
MWAQRSPSQVLHYCCGHAVALELRLVLQPVVLIAMARSSHPMSANSRINTDTRERSAIALRAGYAGR